MHILTGPVWAEKSAEWEEQVWFLKVWRSAADRDAMNHLSGGRLGRGRDGG